MGWEENVSSVLAAGKVNDVRFVGVELCEKIGVSDIEFCMQVNLLFETSTSYGRLNLGELPFEVQSPINITSDKLYAERQCIVFR